MKKASALLITLLLITIFGAVGFMAARAIISGNYFSGAIADAMAAEEASHGGFESYLHNWKTARFIDGWPKTAAAASGLPSEYPGVGSVPSGYIFSKNGDRGLLNIFSAGKYINSSRMNFLHEINLANSGSGGGTDASVTLVAEPEKITAGESSTLTWTPTNAESCSGSSVPDYTAWDGEKDHTQKSSMGVSPTETTTFIIDCRGSSGNTATATARVIVNPVPTTGKVTTRVYFKNYWLPQSLLFTSPSWPSFNGYVADEQPCGAPIPGYNACSAPYPAELDIGAWHITYTSTTGGFGSCDYTISPTSDEKCNIFQLY